jgi:hypothetical protein
MDDENDNQAGSESGSELVPRAPTEEDLVNLCRLLNDLAANYIVIGGFAVIYSGASRFTGDIDLLIDTSLTNESKVYKALESLPDQAVKDLVAGDVSEYVVVRVADEIIVDLMKSACGIDYSEASKDTIVRNIKDVAIPFASPRLLWRMKAKTHRVKDAPDLAFLQEYFESRGEVPPKV